MAFKIKDKRIIVVWICHFTNDEIQKQLKVKRNINKFAPWISLSIDEIKKRNDVELHVISPHRWISRKKEFVIDNIHYYFFNAGIPFYGRHWPGFFRFDIWTNYFFNRKMIKKIVDKIQPDIINLHGIENPYYATSIFKLRKFPILITIQGLKSLGNNGDKDFLTKEKIKWEKRIIEKFNHYGIRVLFLKEYISSLNSNAKFYWYKYPFESSKINLKENEKTYDCVFFNSITKDKGVEDLIEAISIVKQRIPSISLKIIGSCESEYQLLLQRKIDNEGLADNIQMIEFISDQKKLHKIVAQARLSILPTYNDILPGMIIESLKLGIPVIAYAANGVVDFNANNKIIKMIDLGVIDDLAKMVIHLLNNPEEMKKLRLNGLQFACEEFNSTTEVEKLIKAYRSVISQ